MTHARIEAVAETARQGLDATVNRLSEYLTFPAISSMRAHHPDVRRLCERLRADLERMGLQNARILQLPDALPVVTAEWLGAGPDKPTVLIYGHLDLQPVDPAFWDSPPHEAVRRGDRLYARGAADDMGGWVSHLAAFQAWSEAAGGPPCNLRLLIESEEEIGSPNLERYMDAHPEAFASDVMVLTDCENPSVDVPGLTVSLRGLMEVELRCDALSADVHSGLWGGMVPDASMALIKLIARLADEDGRMSVGRRRLSDEEIAAAERVPIPDELVRAGGHIIDGVDPLPVRGMPPAVWLWRQPSVTVLSTSFPQPGAEKNALRRSASARLSVRLAPDQGADEMMAALRQTLCTAPPCGARVTLEMVHSFGPGWLYQPQGEAFAAADRAYEKAWGKPLARVGVGGSIPFVALFGRRYGDLPLILNGVMDPETTAHGPNESLHLGVFEKAILANVYLYDELAQLPKA